MMEWVRPDSQSPLGKGDVELFKAEIDRIAAKSVLEFGPGDSTQVFLDLGIQRIVTCEHKEKWRKVAAKRFKNDPRVKVVSYTNTVPVEVPELNGEKFDLALVDSPQGFYPAREVLEGMEDCSRLNTCLFALEHAKVVLLHDALRPLERGTLGRLNALGYHFEFIKFNDIGIARIERLELHDNGPSTPNPKELGGAAARSSPKRRRSRVGGNPDRLSVRGPEAKEHRGCIDGGDQHGISDSPRSHRRKRSEDGVRGDERDGVIHAGSEGGTRP